MTHRRQRLRVSGIAVSYTHLDVYKRQTLDDQFRSEQLLVQASQANYELASQRFRAGIDDNLAELDAQRALFSAQQTLVQTRLARMSNLVNLYKALGGGWTESSPAKP